MADQNYFARATSYVDHFPPGTPGDPGGITEAPTDGKTYVRQNGAWVAATTVPTPPPTGTHTLTSNNGAISWV